jgi:protein TonB
MSTSTRETEPKAASPSSRVTPSPSRVAPPPSQASRLAAISAEIPVEVHGSRTSPTDGHPIEAFHEETVSVIVFPQGGIVRLAAIVSAGQMIAVTNLNTQRGMLCRVANVRVYPNLKSYVELEFTQPAPGFWGVTFPPEALTPEIAHETQTTHTPENKSVAESAPPAAAIAPSPLQAAREEVLAQPTPEEISADAAAVEEVNLVHVTADEVTANEPENSSESAPVPAAKELQPEDFWGASFPAELMDSSGIPSAALAAPGIALHSPASTSTKARTPAPSSIPPPAPSVAAVSKKPAAAKRPSVDERAQATTETKNAGAVSGDSVDLPIDGDETWDQLLSQLPKKYEQPKPAVPEIHEEDFHVEPAAPKTEIRAPEAPRAAVPADELLSNSDQTPAQSESASPATLKELERLALEHLDTNQDAPRAPSVTRKSPRGDKARRSPAQRARVELPHTQPRIASSATALHSFTSPAPVSAHENAEFTSTAHHPDAVAARDESADKTSFGNFLKDPEPRTSAPHSFTAHSDMLSVSLMDPAPVPIATKAGGLKAGGVIAVAALAVIVVAGAIIFVANSNTGTNSTSAVIGKPIAEQAPVPPGNLRPNTPDLPSNAPNSLAAAASSAAPATPDSKLEVDLSTAVTPPSKNDPSPSAASKSQPKTATRRSAIPPVTLSAPVSASDNPPASTVEPAPTVNGGAIAAANGDAFSKLGANANAAIPRPAAPAASAPASTGGVVKDAHLIRSVAPIYPAFARQNNIQGDVKIDATIDETGRVSKMKVISGPSLLQQPAMDALRQWKYEPSTLDGSPVPVQMIVTLQFHR